MFGMPSGTFAGVWERIRAQADPLVLRDSAKRNTTLEDRMEILRMRNEQHMLVPDIACQTGWSLNTVKRVIKSELNPQRKPRVPWSEKEDERLIHLHERLGLSFAECAARIEGRSVNGARGRYNGWLRDRKTTSTRELPWTAEEDAVMRKLHDQDGLSFSVIAEQMSRGVSDAAVRMKYNRGNVTPRIESKISSGAEATNLAVASTMTN
ncbi:hypothetical protein LTR10_011452 [Elasticomyces elasticus]|nr:hypothetical protein LTR10_011452 [Elasticomyces elasticus]